MSRPERGLPTLLEVRWIVDGMNVIGARPDGWWRDRHGAMVRLVEELERFSLARAEEVAVVFEGPPASTIASAVVEVGNAPTRGRDSGDAEIVRRVAADAHPADLRVVSSDRRLAAQVRAAGATSESAGSFRKRLDDLPAPIG